jgi:hypothetical protein
MRHPLPALAYLTRAERYDIGLSDILLWNLDMLDPEKSITTNAESKAAKAEPVYLGDGLYARFDGCSIELSASQAHGMQAVYLDWNVYRALVGFAQRSWEAG